MTGPTPSSVLRALFLAFAVGQAAFGVEVPGLSGPPVQDGPVTIQASFTLRELNQIDDTQEKFEFGGVLTLQWKDQRQAFDPREAGVSEKLYHGSYELDEVYQGWIPRVILANKNGAFETDAQLLRQLPDGTSTLRMSVDAAAGSSLNMRRYPFDAQRLEAIFEVFGFGSDEINLISDGAHSAAGLHLPQWQVGLISSQINAEPLGGGGRENGNPNFTVSIDVHRKSMFVLRLVAIPLMLIVALSWSVFWMDRSSLGDRINLSFVGILTAVAYQIVIGDLLPHLSYVTLMHAFVNISFLIMCASAVMNLVVGSCDKSGNFARGDLIDQRCRWIFPLAYAGTLVSAALIVFVAFPANDLPTNQQP